MEEDDSLKTLLKVQAKNGDGRLQDVSLQLIYQSL